MFYLKNKFYGRNGAHMKTYNISEFLGDRHKLLQQFFSATELTIVLLKLLFLNKTIWHKFMFQN